MRLYKQCSLALCWLLATICPITLAVAQVADERLPKPAEIEKDVNFWVRVYTEISTNQGFLHDDWNLDVVYETLNLPEGIERRQRDRQVTAIKKRYRSLLLRLARESHKDLSKEAQRVLDLWPEGTSRKELRLAAKRIRFQLGQSDKFKAGLIRSGRWMPHIKQTLGKLDIPEALAALPHVESSFEPSAYSFIGAAGMWQFTRSTGRRYMQIDHVVDERLDPFISTEAAAKLLKHNFGTTGTWPLAITAYNHGAAGMRRAVRQTGGNDIVTILRKYKSRTFKFASRNFYVAFLAAVEVSRDAKAHFGEFELDAEATGQVIKTPAYIPAKALAKALQIDLALLKEMNPALRPPVWSSEKHIPKGFKLRLPSSEGGVKVDLLAMVPANSRFRYQLPDTTYRVRRGDSLSGIADRFRVSVSDLMRMNNLRSRHFIRTGQVLRLPKTARGRQIERELVDGVYRVQRGDTLSVIARAFEVSEAELVQLNSLKNPHSIKVNQVLRVAAVETPVVEMVVDGAEVDKEQPPTTELALSEQIVVEPVMTGASNGEAETVADTEVLVTQDVAGTVAPAQVTLSADPSNYLVAANDTIFVQVGETLGHYAEWLGLRAGDLRRINRLKFRDPIPLGGKLKLDFSRVTKESFEASRIAYHRNVQEAYFAQHQIVDVEERTIQRGDSIWDLTHFVYKVPLWLFMQYNPDIKLDDIQPGIKVMFPKVELKS